MELQWPLILFTTLLAWAAGVFGAQCLYALRGQGTRAQMPALITSAVLLVVGGIAVFFHLEHWERIFNGFGHLSSGITQELIAIVVLAVVMVVYFVYLRRGGDEAKVPAWLAAVGLVLAVVLVAVMGHSYMMASLPAWDSVLQIGSLLGAACGFGPATMALICAVRDESSDLDAKANLIGQAVNVVLVVAYLIAMQATAELRELVAETGASIPPAGGVEAALAAEGIPCAPASETLDVIDAALSAACDAGLANVARSLLATRLRHRPDDALMGVLRSFGEPA